MMIHLHFLKNGTLHLQSASVFCGAIVLLQGDNPIQPHADSLNINVSSPPPWSLVCQIQFEGLLCFAIFELSFHWWSFQKPF